MTYAWFAHLKTQLDLCMVCIFKNCHPKTCGGDHYLKIDLWR